MSGEIEEDENWMLRLRGGGGDSEDDITEKRLGCAGDNGCEDVLGVTKGQLSGWDRMLQL